MRFSKTQKLSMEQPSFIGEMESATVSFNMLQHTMLEQFSISNIGFVHEPKNYRCHKVSKKIENLGVRVLNEKLTEGPRQPCNAQSVYRKLLIDCGTIMLRK